MPNQFDFYGQWHERGTLYFVHRYPNLTYRFNHWAQGIIHRDSTDSTSIIINGSVKFKLILTY